MRKLNGITINGEYLGNSVVINGMFRAICTISPVIMRDFIMIINKIDRLEDAVKIHNFNCGFDFIDIEFENKTSKGMASLYFKLHDGEPLLRDCRLIIDDEEYSTFQDKIKLHSKNTQDMTTQETPLPQLQEDTQDSELERLQKIRELREKKQAMQKQKSEASNSGNKNLNLPKNAPKTPDLANLSPEQQKEKKRQELLEKKRKLLEAKKAKSGESSDADTSSDSDTMSKNQDGAKGTDAAASEETKTKDVQSNFSTDASDNKPSGIITQPDGTVTNEQGQTVVKEERINPDGSVSEVFVNPENPSEVYEKNELGEFVSNNNNNINDNAEDTSADNTSKTQSASSMLDNLSDEDLANMSDEELEALEAELNAEIAEDSGYDTNDENVYDNGYNNYNPNAGYPNNNFGIEFAEKITQATQELAQGLTEGLTQGLSQGLAQGLAQGFGNLAGSGGFGNLAGSGGFGNLAGSEGFGNQNAGANFGNQNMDNQNFGTSFGNNEFSGGDFGNQPFFDNFSSENQKLESPQTPSYFDIDNMNMNASNYAKDAYNYDENSNADDISEFYSDFYDDIQSQEEQRMSGSLQYDYGNQNKEPSELDLLKAELEALKNKAGENKELMSVEDFMAAQKELSETKEKLRRQKMKIVGSNGRVSASALEGGVFAAGKKLYKWGDTRVLDE